MAHQHERDDVDRILKGIILEGISPAIILEMNGTLREILTEVRASRSRVKSGEARPTDVARLLSPSQVCERYAIGKRSLMRKIELGEIPAVRRERCRGGQPGWLLRFEDCEIAFAKPDNLLIPAVKSRLPASTP